MSINYVCTSVCFSLTLIENCYISGILHTSITFWSFHVSYLSNWIVIVNLSTTWTSLVTNGLLVTSDQLSFTLHMTSCMSDKFSVYLQEGEQKYYNYSKIRQMALLVLKRHPGCHIYASYYMWILWQFSKQEGKEGTLIPRQQSWSLIWSKVLL